MIVQRERHYNTVWVVFEQAKRGRVRPKWTTKSRELRSERKRQYTSEKKRHGLGRRRRLDAVAGFPRNMPLGFYMCHLSVM